MPSNGASDDHGDDGDDHKMIKCWTLASRAPDAESERPVRLGQGTGRQAPDAGLCVRWSLSGVRSVLQSCLSFSPVSTGRSGA